MRADGGHVYLLETRQVPQDPFEYAGALHFFRESSVHVLSPVAAGLTQVGSLQLPQLVSSQDLGTGLELAGDRLYLDYNYPFAPRWTVPPQVVAHTVTLQARATDTGGNQTVSAPLIVQLTP